MPTKFFCTCRKIEIVNKLFRDEYLTNFYFQLSCTPMIFANPMKLRDVTPVKECIKSGMMCETCDSSAMCVKIGDTYKKVSKMTCASGSTCLAGVCTKEVNPPCDYNNIDFPCQYQGRLYYFLATFACIKI